MKPTIKLYRLLGLKPCGRPKRKTAVSLLRKPYRFCVRGTPRSMRAILLFVFLLLLLLPLLVWAQEPIQRWRRLSPEEREKVLRNYQRWLDLPPKRQEELRYEFEDWRYMPEKKREKLKKRYEEFRRLPPEERRQWREKYNEHYKLSPEEKKALRERLKKKRSHRQRRGH